MIGIGIDTGGTCTDAVIFDNVTREVLSWGKTLTTKEDLKVGILNAMRMLDQDLLKRADYIALSTTLATNACVENKGGRAKLVFIGLDPKAVTMMRGTYGLPDISDIYFLECRPMTAQTSAVPPDWNKFREDVKRDFREYDSVALVQLNPQLDGGQYEREAEEIIKEELGILCVRGYDLYQEINVQKRGATALLNARLMPLVVEFFDSIEKSMKEMGLDLNIYVMKSDGTVMSREYAMSRPVETLLCGPAASVRGAMELTGTDDGIVIDMGGTTSDVALIRNGRPISSNGVKVGQWSTMVKGVDIDTFALGGDTGVLLKDDEIYLDERRVIPISVLALNYPQVIRGLNDILGRFFSMPLNEGLYLLLVRKPEDLSGYTQKERDIIRHLEEGPLSYLQLSDRMGISHAFLNLKRLEDEGIIMRSGITPTDAMHILGDYTDYSTEAAVLGFKYLALQTRTGVEKLAERVYELVVYRLYNNLINIEFNYEIGGELKPEDRAALSKLTGKILRHYYDDTRPAFINSRMKSEYRLIGVGAPTGIFLNDTSEIMETVGIIPEYSQVANAIGAAAGDIVTEFTATIRTGMKEDYVLTAGDKAEYFEDYDEAVRAARETAIRIATEKARVQTSEGTIKTTVDVEEDFFRLPAGTSVLIGTRVTARAQIVM